MSARAVVSLDGADDAVVEGPAGLVHLVLREILRGLAELAERARG